MDTTLRWRATGQLAPPNDDSSQSDLPDKLDFRELPQPARTTPSAADVTGPCPASVICSASTLGRILLRSPKHHTASSPSCATRFRAHVPLSRPDRK